MANAPGTLVMEDVTIVFRNFKGKPSRFNEEGDRNFGVLIDDDLAEQLRADEWNVKILNPREDADEGEMPQAFIPVAAEYRKGKPPTVVMINQDGKRTHLDVDTIETLDYVDIKTVDLIVRPSRWTVGEKTGLKAYLQSMYVTIEEDELARKYAEDNQSPPVIIPGEE